jgi:hypothetical protein
MASGDAAWLRQAGAAALIGVVISFRNHNRTVHAAPSGTDVGMMEIAAPIKIFDPSNYPEHSSPGHKCRGLRLRQRAALDGRMVEVFGIGKECLGGLPHARDDWSLPLVENDARVRDSHSNCWATSSVSYDDGASAGLSGDDLIAVDRDWSNPWPFIVRDSFSSFGGGLGGLFGWRQTFADEPQLNQKQASLNTSNENQAKRDESDAGVSVPPLPSLAVALCFAAMGITLRRFF